ncbi:MAG: hypothetical protein II886_01530 [Prevotella sp.]|nr:hypothetical protein [Prevotella sp.]
MKKLLLAVLLMAATLSAKAADYPYLVFVTTDGTSTSVSVSSSLSITISGTTLTAGSRSFTLSNLSKMYFSATEVSTGIKAITQAELDEVTAVYDLNGKEIGKSQMQKGVYIIKSKNGTYKIAVK